MNKDILDLLGEKDREHILIRGDVEPEIWGLVFSQWVRGDPGYTTLEPKPEWHGIDRVADSALYRTQAREKGVRLQVIDACAPWIFMPYPGMHNFRQGLKHFLVSTLRYGDMEDFLKNSVSGVYENNHRGISLLLDAYLEAHEDTSWNRTELGPSTREALSRILERWIGDSDQLTTISPGMGRKLVGVGVEYTAQGGKMGWIRKLNNFLGRETGRA